MQRMLTCFQREKSYCFVVSSPGCPGCLCCALLTVMVLAETFMTDGTFDRVRFVSCCREFALSKNVQQYPGRRSVWILDGVRISSRPNFTYYLRSIGIIPISLPAYCPFFNPIEF